MRITNRMMTNNSLNNINKNKNKLSKLDQQYSTGKKIQKPSDDPIIAVRALKLRTTVSEIDQYYNKNIPDGLSWMEETEGALTNINELLTLIHESFDQGANGTYERGDLEGIVKELKEMKGQIYQEGNTNYAGRYVFSGYKTSTSLIFNEDSTTTRYKITEKFGGSAIETVRTVKGSYELPEKLEDIGDYSEAPEEVESYRIRLSYGDLDGDLDEDLDDEKKPKITYVDSWGEEKTIYPNIVSASGPDDPYSPASYGVNFIPETGELILSKEIYNEMRLQKDGDISVKYDKTQFDKGDLRPEHYFDCTTTLADPSDTETTEDPSDTKTTYEAQDQQIQYEITFSQKLTINTQGKDAISHGIGRVIDELESAVQDLGLTEKKIEEVDKLIQNPETTEAQQKALEKLKEQLETEKTLREHIISKKFGSGLTEIKKYQDQVSMAIADAGSRYVRLELTDSRLDSQLVDTKELMSNNEDANLAEVIINYTAADAIYNASLNAASKIVKNTLLDFI